MNDPNLTQAELIGVILKDGDAQNATATATTEKIDGPDPCDHLDENNPHRNVAALHFRVRVRTTTRARLRQTCRNQSEPAKDQRAARPAD